MNRRGFLGSILALGAAPAIVRADSLMRIIPRGLIVPPLVINMLPPIVRKRELYVVTDIHGGTASLDGWNGAGSLSLKEIRRNWALVGAPRHALAAGPGLRIGDVITFGDLHA